MLLAEFSRYLACVCLALLLRPIQRGRLDRELRFRQVEGCPDRQADDPLLHGQMVRSLSDYEASSLGR